MQEALYHPQFGYYTAHITDVGARGDFSTAATLDEGLGIAIAAWIKDRSKALQWNRTFVIEVGAGSGALASTVLRHLGWVKRLRTDYTIVEASPILRKRQQEALRGRRVAWCHSMEEALKQSGGRALIFSNELVDAFPCRLFERVDSGWKEVGVYFGADGSLREVLLDHEEQGTSCKEFAHFAIGQRFERHDSYRSWLRSWRDEWKEGHLLTIDYGEPAETLYVKKPRGSLRAYWKHRRYTGMEIYARFGRQDITADINFSNLIKWGEESGWKMVSLNSQREFLMAWLTREKGEKLSSRFTTPGEAGDAFRLLEQKR